MSGKNEINEYLRRCLACRDSLCRLSSNLTIDIGPFASSLKYVLQTKLKHPCVLYSVEYGDIDFTVKAIRFKLQWPPTYTHVRLLCKHLEGDKYIDTGYFITDDKDCFAELMDAIDFSVNNVTPFDV